MAHLIAHLPMGSGVLVGTLNVSMCAPLFRQCVGSADCGVWHNVAFDGAPAQIVHNLMDVVCEDCIVAAGRGQGQAATASIVHDNSSVAFLVDCMAQPLDVSF